MKPDSAQCTAAQQLLERYTNELTRLQQQQRGLETKMASLRAKIEAAQEILDASQGAKSTVEL